MLRISAVLGSFDDNNKMRLTRSPPANRLPSNDNQVRLMVDSVGQLAVLDIAIRAKGNKDKAI